MKLVACKACHAQYDVSDGVPAEFPCRCGATVRAEAPTGVDARVLRCGSCGAAVAETDEACRYCASPIRRDRRDLSLICPECHARNAEDTRFCTSCGVPFRPRAVHAEGYELPCPACATTMPPHQVGGVPLNECPGCHGLWVPRESFDLLINRAIAAHRERVAAGFQGPTLRATRGNPARNKVVYRRCPECDQVMARRNFRQRSGVIVDRCPRHGTWLDADELEQITGYILSGKHTADGYRETGLTAEAAAIMAAARSDAPARRAPPRTTGRTRSRRHRSVLGEVGAGGGLLGFLVELFTTEIDR